ncbi:dual specificity protein phosphatase [Acrasis kona]|uniref:protein-tyrosine-phosphatase n=1 Tax=Acrasis kona TaxID=1008807 RepID=A0AAW2YST6_9EUKA
MNEENRPTQIEDRLFIGGIQHRDTNILNSNSNYSFTIFKFIEIDDLETEDFEQYFDECADFINTTLTNPSNQILVHCQAGQSRSASALIAYYIKYRGLTLEDALSYVRERKPDVSPNKGFQRQLNV